MRKLVVLTMAALSLALQAGCAGMGPSPVYTRTDAQFAALKVGIATRDDVARAMGPPDEQTYLPLRDLTVWSYRYKQSGVWDAMMHVHFDRGGVVREMMAGPDPEREERRGFFLR